jgi:hypothetical protein
MYNYRSLTNLVTRVFPSVVVLLALGIILNLRLLAKLL